MTDPTNYAAFVLGLFVALGIVTVGSVVAELRRRIAERHAREDRLDAETFEEAA